MCNPPIADGRANITQRKGISVMANVLFLYICDSFFYLTEKCQSVKVTLTTTLSFHVWRNIV